MRCIPVESNSRFSVTGPPSGGFFACDSSKRFAPRARGCFLKLGKTAPKVERTGRRERAENVLHGFLYRKPAFSWEVSERLNKKAAPDLVLSRKSGKMGKYWLTYGKVCGILIKENREMLNTSPKAVHSQHRFPFHRKGSQPSFPAVFRPLPASCRA